MPYPYRKSGFLPLFFLGVICSLLFFAAPARADPPATLSQFQAYDEPHEMPDISFQDARGLDRHLSDYRGQWVLVNLWATWCMPCRQEMPALDKLQSSFKGAGLKILPISMDNDAATDKISAFFQEHQIKQLPILRDPESQAMRTLHPLGLPTSYLVAPDGRAVGKIEGFVDWAGPKATQLITSYIQK